MAEATPLPPRVLRADRRYRRQLFILYPSAIVVFFAPVLYALKNGRAVTTALAIGIPVALVLGALLLDTIVTRLVVSEDAIELVGLWSRKRLLWDEVAGWERVRGSERRRGGAAAIDLIPRAEGAPRLRIPDTLTSTAEVKALLACLPEHAG